MCKTNVYVRAFEHGEKWAFATEPLLLKLGKNIERFVRNIYICDCE